MGSFVCSTYVKVRTLEVTTTVVSYEQKCEQL